MLPSEKPSKFSTVIARFLHKISAKHIGTLGNEFGIKILAAHLRSR